MQYRIIITLAAAFLFLAAIATEIHAMNTTLDAKNRSLVDISALSAAGELENLKTALAQGLDAGMTVNEIKEVLVQVYAYAGFPRSLNAIATFQTVLDGRKEAGVNDPEGKLPSPLPPGRSSLEFGTENQTRLIGQPVGGGIFAFAPAIDQFLKAHLFGDIFQRDNLDWKRRELATIAMLAAIPGVESQLQAHLVIGMHNGLTQDELRSAAAVIEKSIGTHQAKAMNRMIDGLGNTAKVQ